MTITGAVQFPRTEMEHRKHGASEIDNECSYNYCTHAWYYSCTADNIHGSHILIHLMVCECVAAAVVLNNKCIHTHTQIRTK